MVSQLQPSRIPCMEASTKDPISSDYRLYDAENRVQSLFDLFILSLHQIPLPYGMLKLLIWLLRGQLLYSPLQALNLTLRSLPNRPLSLSIICSLLAQLLRGKVGHTSPRGRCPSLLARTTWDCRGIDGSSGGVFPRVLPSARLGIHSNWVRGRIKCLYATQSGC